MEIKQRATDYQYIIEKLKSKLKRYWNKWIWKEHQNLWNVARAVLIEKPLNYMTENASQRLNKKEHIKLEIKMRWKIRIRVEMHEIETKKTIKKSTSKNLAPLRTKTK